MHINDENVVNFRCENGLFKCSFKCPHCEKIVPCNHNKSYWVCGNLTAHLKTHVDFAAENYQVNPDNTVSKITDGPPALKILKISENHSDVLKAITST